jgi:hypothetical protein
MARKKRVRDRSGITTLQLVGEMRAAFDWLLADEQRKTGVRPAKANMLREMIWAEALRRGRKPKL